MCQDVQNIAIVRKVAVTIAIFKLRGDKGWLVNAKFLQPHRYNIRYGYAMGYILEEHFVTLLRCRR